ncbi:hypothetical protein D9611_004078 [Ephemerocybe angulata]|uniref:Uncharacterized protein n=1 Tax=Ephemerocybe angulata TaxID=980116 RepID=A0A8H5F5P5_9AGAR|nr:hypothetical protein D9611_004078 [Tulosesus angulatus]
MTSRSSPTFLVVAQLTRLTYRLASTVRIFARLVQFNESGRRTRQGGELVSEGRKNSALVIRRHRRTTWAIDTWIPGGRCDQRTQLDTTTKPCKYRFDREGPRFTSRRSRGMNGTRALRRNHLTSPHRARTPGPSHSAHTLAAMTWAAVFIDGPFVFMHSRDELVPEEYSEPTRALPAIAIPQNVDLRLYRIPDNSPTSSKPKTGVRHAYPAGLARATAVAGSTSALHMHNIDTACFLRHRLEPLLQGHSGFFVHRLRKPGMRGSRAPSSWCGSNLIQSTKRLLRTYACMACVAIFLRRCEGLIYACTVCVALGRRRRVNGVRWLYFG